MIELLRKSVAVGSSGRCVSDSGTVGYDELLRRAESAAAYLVDHAIDRFAVVDFDAATVLMALAGASLAGAEACIYPPESADGVKELAVRFRHEYFVTERDDLAGLGTVVEPGALAAIPARSLPLPDPRPHLVLTTGTTGQPRGVRHSWTRLVRRYQSLPQEPDQRWLLCYGTHQFAGLQVLLHVLAVGSTLVAPSPRRPVEGLAAMRSYGVTHASATPTYWRYLLANLGPSDEDALPLRQITLGGEAADAGLLERLRQRFPQAAVSHVYAASEFGSTSSVRDGRTGLPVDALGAHSSGTELKVVDGELWVRSRDGMLGYFGEPDLDVDRWRATGDLVRIEGDRVLFEGRTSEIVNVGGVKVSPLAVEELVREVPGVDAVRAYGRKNPLAGNVVAVDLVLAPGADADAVRDSVRTVAEALEPAARPRSVRVVAELTTRGGKVVRRGE